MNFGERISTLEKRVDALVAHSKKCQELIIEESGHRKELAALYLELLDATESGLRLAGIQIDTKINTRENK